MESKIIFGEMLDYFRKQNGMTMDDLGKAMGKTKSAVSRWISGENYPKVDDIEKLTELFNTDVETLVFGAGNKQSFPKSIKYTYFPYAAVSAGSLSEVDAMTENDAETICLSNETMGKYAGNKDIFVTRINGESMNSVIPDKSLVAVKRLDNLSEFQNGDIVVFRYGSEMALKRFINDKSRNRYIFRPDSSDDRYVDIIVSYEEAEMEIIEMYGKVVVYVVQL